MNEARADIKQILCGDTLCATDWFQRSVHFQIITLQGVEFNRQVGSQSHSQKTLKGRTSLSVAEDIKGDCSFGGQPRGQILFTANYISATCSSSSDYSRLHDIDSSFLKKKNTRSDSFVLWRKSVLPEPLLDGLPSTWKPCALTAGGFYVALQPISVPWRNRNALCR